MKQLLHILKYKILANSRLDINFTFGNLIKEFGSILVYLLFAYGAFVFSKTILSILLEQLNIGLFLLHQFLSIIFFIFFISVNVGNIIVSWSTLYKSQEIHFYFTKPILPYKIFFIKLLDNIFYSSSTLLLILISVILGYVSYFNLSIGSFVIIIILNIIPFILTSASIGIIILLIIVKLAAKLGPRKLIISLFLGYISIIIFYFDALSPLTLVYNVLENYPNVDQYFGSLIPKVMRYLPHQWLSESLYWLVNNDSNKLLLNTSKQIASAIFFFFLAMILGRLWYYKTWLMDIRFTTKTRSEKSILANLIESLFTNSKKLFSIILKDLIIFFRDSTQVLHSLMLLLLVVIFMISSSGISYRDFEQKNMAGVVFISIFTFNILLISTLSLRFIFPLISLEGLTFWKIRTSPINISSLINAKIFPYFLLIMITTVMLTISTHYRLAPHLIPQSIAVLSSIAYFHVMMNYGMGVLFVNYKEKNAIRIASSRGASLTFLFSLIYMVIVVAIIYTPIQEHFTLAITGGYLSYHKINISFYIVSIFSLLTGSVFYLSANKSITKDF